MNRRTGLGELEILAVRSRVDAAVVLAVLSSLDVRDEHVRQLVEAVLVVGAAAHGDRGTVHVHLAVTDLVEPRPGEGVIAVRHVGGQRPVEDGGAVAVGVLGQVAGRVGRTAALNGMKDLELGALRDRLIHGQGQLAGAAAVNSRAGEGERLRLASFNGVHLDDLANATIHFARVVSARGIQGRVGGVAVRDRALHNHVCIGHSRASRQGQNDGAKRRHGCFKREKSFDTGNWWELRNGKRRGWTCQWRIED